MIYAYVRVSSEKQTWENQTFAIKEYEQLKKYGGADGVIADSIKDMGNNIKGFYHGYFDDQPCYPLLNNPLP